MAYRPVVGVPAAEAAQPGFDVFDDVVRLPDAHGLVVVTVSPSDLRAVARHVERRAAQLGRRTVRSGERVESVWRDVAQRLGAGSLSYDAEEAARRLARVAGGERAVVVAELSVAHVWDVALVRALAEHESAALFVLLVVGAAEFELPGVTQFDVSSRMDAASLSRWWEAVAAEQSERQGGALTQLESWLEAAAARSARGQDADDLAPAARRLLGRLELAHRAWPAARLEGLGDPTSMPQLVSAGFVETSDGLVAVRAGAPDVALQEDAEHVADVLAATFPQDALAFTRAAELWVAAGVLQRAEESMRRALVLADDGGGRAALWRRWRAAVDGLSASSAAALRLSGAELALELGDVEVALEWAQRAAGAEPKSRVAFVLGRAALARGDLVSAAAALERAQKLSEGDAQRDEATVQIAEVRYASGELSDAEALARQVLERSELPGTRLAARNLLGKLLLARGEWVAADAHFAADECEAVGLGESTAELRARVNRAVALLSRGSREEAGVMLEQVLREGEARNERRAVGFALSNLAVLAIERHDYARALELLERTLAAHRRLGDRLNFARDVTNLVELRLRLGLIDQAEQALRFGRHALGPGAPASRVAEVGLAAAQVHLARGRTLDAEREVRSALRAASLSSDGDKLGECHRLAARIALEDGVVARAEAETTRARELSRTPYDRGEVAVLEALVARAAGRPALELCGNAVVAARESGDEELAREAHVIFAELELARDETERAAAEIQAAVALRDEVARGLPAALREAYLSRGALVRLSRLERISGDVEPAPRSIPSEPPPRLSASPARYVGRHPSVRALLGSVQRVGRTGATVLVYGESGTGKELVAELLHAASERAAGPLVKVNCAALVETLLLSELFGHEKGAFTGATSRRRGRFERAHGGTLFLDEIGDISPRTQVALLRVLEERRIERVGGGTPIDVDVRIVCATNRDLSELVARGEFREDLYYRLSGITLDVPALRDRLSDLPLLCEAVLERAARERGEVAKRVTPEAIELLARHRWPGNVRELENALRAASVLSDGDEVDVSDLVEHVEALRRIAAEPGPSLRESPASAHGDPVGPALEGEAGTEDVTGIAYREIRDARVSLPDLKRNIERDCISQALAESQGNITRAAALLGMKRPRLSQLVKQYGLSTTGTEDPS